jgi:hypothetical protein
MAGDDEVDRSREAAERERKVVDDEPDEPRERPPEEVVREQLRRHDEKLGPGSDG